MRPLVGRPTSGESPSDSAEVTTWLARFHAGERGLVEEVYRNYFDKVDQAVAGVLTGADRETVVHEIFFRLMSDANHRIAFQGGDFRAWLLVVARHHAIDYLRRRNRELPAGLDFNHEATAHDSLSSQTEARLLITHFMAEKLPVQWQPVFQARFIQGLTQSEAAKALRLHRTTLIYQELRIRRLLRKFLLEEAP